MGLVAGASSATGARRCWPRRTTPTSPSSRPSSRACTTRRPDGPALPRRHHQPAALAGRVQGRPGALGEGRPEGPRRQPRASTPRASSGSSTRRSSRQGSDMFLPLFEASGYKEGFLSGQVDPRSAFDGEAMLAQALEIHAVNPNVMVKVPGHGPGLRGHRGAHLPRHRHQQHPHLRALAAARLRQVGHARPREGQGQRRRPLASGARSSPTWRPATATSAACARPAPRGGIEVTEGDVRTRRARDLQEGLPHAQGARLPEQDALLLAAPRPDGRRQAADLAPRGEGRRRHRRHLPADPHRRGHQLPASRGHQVQAEPDRRRSARGRHGEAAARSRTSRAPTTRTATRARSTTRIRRW